MGSSGGESVSGGVPARFRIDHIPMRPVEALARARAIHRLDDGLPECGRIWGFGGNVGVAGYLQPSPPPCQKMETPYACMRYARVAGFAEHVQSSPENPRYYLMRPPIRSPGLGRYSSFRQCFGNLF